MYEGNFFHKIKTNTIINAIFSTRFAINWNKDKGKFTISAINTATNSITIDKDNGTLSWKSSLAIPLILSYKVILTPKAQSINDLLE